MLLSSQTCLEIVSMFGFIVLIAVKLFSPGNGVCFTKYSMIKERLLAKSTHEK